MTAVTPPGARTAREALLAELLGDVDKLLDRVESLQGAVGSSEGKLSTTAAALDEASDRYRLAITAFTDEARTELTEFLQRRASAVATATVDDQRLALHEAARAALRFEASERAAQLATALGKATGRLRDNSAARWLQCLAIGLLSGLVSGALLLHFAAH